MMPSRALPQKAPSRVTSASSVSDPPPSAEPSARSRDLAPVLAFAIPAIVGALAGGDSMGFYDAPELASCAAGLGATHPPGHPLFVALAGVATLLPLGTAALRVTILGALCVGVIGRLAYGLTLPLAHAVLEGAAPVPGRRWVPWLALGHSLGAALGIAVVRQTSRAEVYALAGMLGAATVYLGAAPAGWSAATRARLSVLTLALGGANHHFIAITTAPVALLAVIDRARQGGLRGSLRALAPWAALGALGLAPYALLGLRARAAASIVRVRTAGDLVWTVTARAFQKNSGSGVPGSFRDHLLDVITWIFQSLTPLGLIAAAAGMLIAARRRVAWSGRLGLVALAGVVARAALGFVEGNPDAAGYLAPAVFSLGVLGAAFSGQFWRSIEDAPAAPAGPSPAGRALLRATFVVAPAMMFLPAGAYAMWKTLGDRGDATEVMTAADLVELPPRAIVIAYAPETAFRLRYAQLVDGERPDVTVVPAAFVPWPGMTNTLLARDGALLPVVRDFLSRGSPRMPALLDLAARRPVRIELDPHNLLDAVPYVLPRGTFAEVRTEPTTLTAVRATAPAHLARVERLREALAQTPGADREPRIAEYVLWRAYHDALFFAARGARGEARVALGTARRIAPEARELAGLAAALDAQAEGPIDVAPFVVHAPGRE
jgi:hypothetical protein